MYTHNNRDRRTALATLLAAGHTQKDTAQILGISPSAVCRELQRNSTSDGRYHSLHAEKKARQRRARSKEHYRILEQNPEKARIVQDRLTATWSPEQIAETLNVVSDQTIYSWIRRSRPDLRKHLRRKGRKRRRYGTGHIPSPYQAAKRPISERPAIVTRRERFGDWEGDTARGGDRQSSLVVHTERRSGLVVAQALSVTTAAGVHRIAATALKKYTAHTITYDNGSEFSDHQFIERDTRAMVYFARAGHPEDRGSCENAIGLLREFFPKGTSFATIPRQTVSRAVYLVNHRPRKRHAWRTPCEASGQCCTSGLDSSSLVRGFLRACVVERTPSEPTGRTTYTMSHFLCLSFPPKVSIQQRKRGDKIRTYRSLLKIIGSL